MTRVKERPAKEAAARKRKDQAEAVLDATTDPKLIEPGHVLRMIDHDGDEIFVKVEDLFESQSAGPSVRGAQFSSPECSPKEYVQWRALPLSMLAPPPSQRAPRSPGRARTSGPGRCEHCGGETKGGRFIPGHDAKLKGDLIREGTPEAWAERFIRGWTKDHPPEPTPKVKKMIEEGDAFVVRRVAYRIGEVENG